ncbi:MAG: hypothetical protein RIC55_20380 [Pirellulaceae bacterium]
MTDRNKTLLRTAVRIHDQLARSPTQSVSIGLLDVASDICLDVARRLRKAEARNWQAATDKLRCDLASSLDQLRECAADVRRSLDPAPTPIVLPAPQIYHDLLALHQEFHAVEIDLRQRKITCQTAPIELDDLYLGPFNIILSLDVMCDGDPYQVVAIDPFPADANSNVTHPHVEGDRLCEGDARAPIQRALRQGRLFDFFLIVRQTLETYNPGSAYVDLEEWTGPRCEDCDGRAADPFTCQGCSATLCDECVFECVGCNAIACGACKTICEACHEPYCSECLTPCRTCKTSICEECSTNGQCPDCDRKEEADQTATAEQPTAGAAVQPHGVGEAHLPA